MSNKQLRLGFPYQPSGTNYSDALYRPKPDWGQWSGDYPIVPKLTRTNDGSAQTTIYLIKEKMTFNMSSAVAYNGWSASNEGNFWNWNTSYKPTLSGQTNPYACILGHKGPNSANGAVQSWQRGVVGFSLEHKDTPYSGNKGHYIEDCTLLYRKWSDSSKFYGVDLVASKNKQVDCKHNYANQSPFYTTSPRRDGTQGGFYCAFEPTHAAHQAICTEDYVFQGIYFKWGSYDSPSQFQAKLELWNLRLIYQTHRISDDGYRVVHPMMWTFQDAATSNKLKLTYA